MAKTPAFMLPNPEQFSVTATGLRHFQLKEGTGRAPKASDTVTVHYAGWLEDGTPFDDSYSRGEPATFPLKNVIRGWTEGLQLMKEGGITTFVIPGDLAYGPSAVPGTPIGPNATPRLPRRVAVDQVGEAWSHDRVRNRFTRHFSECHRNRPAPPRRRAPPPPCWNALVARTVSGSSRP